MSESESMIRNLRLKRSAQTPANSEMAICGRKPHRVEIVIIRPEEVVRVMYQTMAYYTRDDPNSETVWPNRNSPVRTCQLRYAEGD